MNTDTNYDIKAVPTAGHCITGTDNIEVFRLITLRAALKLEVMGMKRRGPSVYSVIKREFGLKGTKQSVYNQFSIIVDAKKAKNIAPIDENLPRV